MKHLGASASADQALVASDEARSDLHPPGFDSSREKGAFMAGWLTRHHRSDVAPEEAWLTYLDSHETKQDE